MVKDRQVRRLFKLLQSENSQAVAAAKAGMDPKTARVLAAGQVAQRGPDNSQLTDTSRSLRRGLASTRGWRLQRKYPGRFQDGQLRSFQRKVKARRALEGSAKEVFFSQMHVLGRLRAQSDFTHMADLGITLAGDRSDHLLYHFGLTYSNWEHRTVCFSESFKSLSEGLSQMKRKRRKAAWRETSDAPSILFGPHR